MSSDNSSTTVPTFESKLPAGLLNGLSEQDRYLYTSQDETRQAIAWLVAKMASTADQVELVHQQAKFTNGKVAQATADITALKEAVQAHQQQTEPVVKAYNLAGKMVRSKVFWFGAVLFFGIGAPWLVAHAPDPQALIVWTVKTALGGG